MNNSQIKTAIVSFSARDSKAFMAEDQVPLDLVQVSINMAQQHALRQVDFFLAMERGYIDLTTTGGTLVSTAKDQDDAALVVKRFQRFYTDEDHTEEVAYVSVEDKQRDTGLQEPYVYMQGDKLYYVDAGTTGAKRLYFDCFKQLADLSEDSDNNFLTNFCADWLILQSLIDLQSFLREDERVQISAGLIRNKWESVIAWNEGYGKGTDLSLD